MRYSGHIEAVLIGSCFPDRISVSRSGVHRPLKTGNFGWHLKGPDSIVLSGVYEDDEDLGNVIVCTGHGGRDPNNGCQVADQVLTRQNPALAASHRLGSRSSCSRRDAHKAVTPTAVEFHLGRS